MSKHAGNSRGRVLLGAFYLAAFVSVSAMAAATSPPVFTPNPSAGWFSYTREFIPPASGPGPVQQDPKYPFVSNDEFRATGRQPTFAMGDPNSSILQPWVSETLRKRNELIRSGTPVYSPHASCWPVGVTRFILLPMTQPMYFIQGPKEVVMVLESFNDVRRIYLADKHSENLKPSWQGDSIGHYEGGTLVVDTIGFNDKTFIDGFDTPHTTQLHVIERWHLIDGGETLEVNVRVEDPGAFITPWNASQRYRRFEETVTKADVKTIAVLATPEQGPLLEMICPENPNSFQGLLPAIPVPQTVVPDF